MCQATKTVATWFGIAAGISGSGHSYFEVRQGTTVPGSLVIDSGIG